MSWTGNLVFVYFVVLFVFIIYGGYFRMRVRSREHLGGEFDSILTSCFVVASRCSSAWTGFAAIHAVSVIVLQGAGLSCLPCIGKDQIKSVPSNKTSVSASRRFRFVPVLDNSSSTDDSLRPEPPPIHAMCLRYCILLAAAC